MLLDHAVSRAIKAAHLLERALHSAGTWTITIGTQTVPANRTVLSDRIVFSALFPEAPDGDVRTLDHDGVSLCAHPFSGVDFAPFIVDWELVIVGDSVGV